MNKIWELPRKAEIQGEIYKIHGDYRDILEIISYLENPDLPEFIRWRIAVRLFYDPQLPQCAYKEGMDFLGYFIRCGQEENSAPMPKRLDWQLDAPAIISDINRVAGTEIRNLPFIHWWTFIAWFNGIGQGQLSAVLSLREKIRKGKKLEKWEREYYLENKSRIDLPKHYTRKELGEREQLQKMLESPSPVKIESR